jgi:two-component system nitrate/nitrite response regulator NarL
LSVLAFADEPVLQIGLQSVLAGAPGFRIAGVYATAAHLAGAAQQYQPQVILYSLSLDPELAQVNSVRRASPDSAIILWARDFSGELAHQALDMGIQGFLSTTAGPDTMLECLRFAGTGEMWMERSLANTLLNSRPVALSRRQTQLLSLLVQGLKNREIATELGISEGTVKAYLTTLFEKVGARDRFELALYGLKNLRNVRGVEAERDLRMKGQVRGRGRSGVRTVA